MILELLIILPIGAILLFFLAGRSIPTPIPKHIAERGNSLASDGLILTVYRLILVAVALSLSVFAILANPTGLIAFLTAGVVAWLIMDDLTQTLMDIWNAEFWRAEP